MKIGITGATGFIGSELTRQALAAGHDVVCFSRNGSPKNDPFPDADWRTFSMDVPIDASGLDAVVHLAGESILGRWTAAKKDRIRKSRIEGTRRVVEGIAAATPGPLVLVSGSAIGFYGDGGEREITEASSKGKGFLADVAADWEAEAVKAACARVVILRSGMVLGRGAGAMRLIAPVFKLGLGGKLGSGQQWMSAIHVSDVAGLVLHAIGNSSVSGPLNAVMPEPIRNAEFTRVVAASARRPAIFAVPAFVLRLVLGDLSHLVLDSQRVLPVRATESGYRYQFPDLAVAAADVFER